jgi:hypothetical protein
MFSGLPYSFPYKHHLKLYSEFVLWTQIVRGTGFWLELRWETLYFLVKGVKGLV